MSPDEYDDLAKTIPVADIVRLEKAYSEVEAMAAMLDRITGQIASGERLHVILNGEVRQIAERRQALQTLIATGGLEHE